MVSTKQMTCDRNNTMIFLWFANPRKSNYMSFMAFEFLNIYIRTVVHRYLVTLINTNAYRIYETEYGANLTATTTVQEDVEEKSLAIPCVFQFFICL